MELHLINCRFNIFFFYVPIKLNKNTANAYTYYGKYSEQYYHMYTKAAYFFKII